jgi:hypothetical protein
MQVEMRLESVKKHSVRYNAAPEFADPCVTSVYVMKSTLPTPFPEKFLLTISFPQGG